MGKQETVLHTIVDTSIFRQNPKRDNAGFVALVKQCEAGLVKLYIPYVVQEEFLSQKVAEVEKPFRDILKNLGILKKKEWATTQDIETFKQQEQECKQIRDSYIQAVRDEFFRWTAYLDAELLDVQSHHGKHVVQAYFQGNKPFKERKNRNDFPDAFIWQTVLDFVDNGKTIHVISADHAMLEACQTSHLIVPHGSLEEFIESVYLKDALLDQFVQQYWDVFIQALSSNLEKIRQRVADEWEFIDYILEMVIPEHNTGASWSIMPIRNFHIFLDDVKYYGYGLVIAPISFTVAVDVLYSISQTDYVKHQASKRLTAVYPMEESITSNVYYTIEEQFPVQVQGEAFLNLQAHKVQDIEKINIQELIENADLQLDSIDNATIDYTKYRGRLSVD